MKPDHAAFVSAEVGALARAGGDGSGGDFVVCTLESFY